MSEQKTLISYVAATALMDLAALPPKRLTFNYDVLGEDAKLLELGVERPNGQSYILLIRATPYTLLPMCCKYEVTVDLLHSSPFSRREQQLIGRKAFQLLKKREADTKLEQAKTDKNRLKQLFCE